MHHTPSLIEDCCQENDESFAAAIPNLFLATRTMSSVSWSCCCVPHFVKTEDIFHKTKYLFLKQGINIS